MAALLWHGLRWAVVLVEVPLTRDGHAGCGRGRQGERWDGVLVQTAGSAARFTWLGVLLTRDGRSARGRDRQRTTMGAGLLRLTCDSAARLTWLGFC